MKKKRSAKQLANDKRLGRMAKARAKRKREINKKQKRVIKKREGARIKRKKNVLRTRQTAIQRATNPKRKKWYIIGRLAAKNTVNYHNGISFNAGRSQAALYPLAIAKQIAKRSGKRSVVALSTSTAKQIKDFLTGKA